MTPINLLVLEYNRLDIKGNKLQALKREIYSIQMTKLTLILILILLFVVERYV